MPTKMFSDAISSSTKLTLDCQPTFAATAWPVSRAAPTTLDTLPAAVDDRSLANSCGTAAGNCASALTEPVITCEKPVPTYLTASTGFCRWKTVAGRDAEVAAVPGYLGSVACAGSASARPREARSA